MTTNTTKILSSKIGDASLKRPKFSTGLLLQDDDLTQVVDYMRGMTRLLFRSMLGCGVLCGFKVESKIVCNNTTLEITVNMGVALDCRGELIELPNKETIQYTPACNEALPKVIWVVICHKERDCAPRDVLCSTQDGETAPVYTRTREGYEIKIFDGIDYASPACCSCTSTLDNPPTVTNTCCDYVAIPNPNDSKDCYAIHYTGDCSCECECNCIVLAKVYLSKMEKNGEWRKLKVPEVDHSVRRYIRPVLMSDPLLRKQPSTTAAAQEQTTVKEEVMSISSTPSQPASAQKEKTQRKS